MENSINHVRLSGFTGSHPVIVNFENNKKMGRISLAVNEFYRNSAGETVNQTQWFNLVFWNKKVEQLEAKVKKGSGIRIEGRLSNQSYTDKKGDIRYSTEIIVTNFEVFAEANAG